MEREAKKLLLDILTSCRAIRDFTSGKSFHDYEQTRQLRSATEREFEVIGEALNRLRRLVPDVAAKISSTETIIAFRNRIIHGYDSVDDLIVWNTVQNDLPALQDEVEKLAG
ncbi:MAG TPA: HepT-like ribonuclease domain-containing protein [Verrucomicrobiae bacterium]|jgi:uncharacterized protein with HEPN domain